MTSLDAAQIVRGKLWGKQSCPEGSKRPEMPVLPDTADRPQDRAAQPLVLPPNCRDVTAEKIGTVIGIVGAMAAGKATKPG